MHKGMFLLLLCLVVAAGCGGDKPKYTQEELDAIPLPPRSGLPESSGGMVLAVGNETITSDEIVEPLLDHFGEYAEKTDFEQFREKAEPQVQNYIISRISNILLYQEAKRDSSEQIDETLEKLAEAEVRKFVLSFNGDWAEAENELKQLGMDWKSFKDYQKKSILSQSYVSSKLPKEKPITYNEMLEEYNQMKEKYFVTEAMVKLRVIDIDIKKIEPKDPNKAREQIAMELATDLFLRIRDGEDFGELAKQYSHGHRRIYGGLWKPVNPESLAEPYNILAQKAEKMEPSQIVGPIETKNHLFIMRLEEKQAREVKPFEKVQKQIEAKIRLERQKKAIDDLSATLVEKAALNNMNRFCDFCVRQIYQKSIY